MEDANIYIRNMTGGKSGARQRLSAKGSVSRKKSISNAGNHLKKLRGGLGSTISHISTGSSSAIMAKNVGRAGMTGAVIAVAMAGIEKGVSFGISLTEANTGEQLRANNSRATIKTVTTMGTNYLYGAVKNELFTKKIISRQNIGLDYYREVYQLNIEGAKIRRI